MTTAPTPGRSPLERARALINTTGTPKELRVQARALLAELGAERRTHKDRQKKVNARIGVAANRLAQMGVSYERQSEECGIDRNSLYRSGGEVNFDSVPLDTRERGKLIRTLTKLAPRRDETNAAINANSEGMRELVFWAHHELELTVGEISKATGLHRSSTYGWIGHQPQVPAQRRPRRAPGGAGHTGRRKSRAAAR